MKRAIKYDPVDGVARWMCLPCGSIAEIRLLPRSPDRHLQEDQEAYARNMLADRGPAGRRGRVVALPHLLEGEKDPSGAIIDFLEKARGVKFLVLGIWPWLHGASHPSFHHRAGGPKVARGLCRCPSWWCRPSNSRKSPSPAISHEASPPTPSRRRLETKKAGSQIYLVPRFFWVRRRRLIPNCDQTSNLYCRGGPMFRP